MSEKENKKLRSQLWFDNTENPGMTALYLERYLNYGLTSGELRSGKPIIGIAQTGNDLTPCNRHHLQLAERVKAGIRDAGGIPMEFPVHPLQETGKRPTAALDRNLAYLGLVEVLHGYPLDGVVLTTGCDKTTPACLMAAATTNMPSIVLSGGPMLDGHYHGMLAGSGTVIWHARELYAAKKIDYDTFIEMVSASAPSVGHCNTMGTATSMNCMAEALGMSLTGCAAIPGPYRERGQMAYETGRRIVDMVREDLTPSKVMTREAFENAIVACSAIGGSSNCVWHLIAIARHMDVHLVTEDFQTHGRDIPLLVNCQPAGEHLGEGFHRAGGLPAVMNELLKKGKLNADALTVSGKTMGENVKDREIERPSVIRPYDDPLMEHAGYCVLTGNIFDEAIMKTSVISKEFREKFLSNPDDPEAFEGTAVVFEGPEDYHHRINDPSLPIDDNSILFMRYTGPVGYPGSAEVVNMIPPDRMVSVSGAGLPCIGDGRQSGTSYSPSILHASPEAAIGGNLAILKTGDRVRVDMRKRRVDMLVSEDELAERRKNLKLPELRHQTPWQKIYREGVSQLSTGAVLEDAVGFHNIIQDIPRDSH